MTIGDILECICDFADEHYIFTMLTVIGVVISTIILAITSTIAAIIVGILIILLTIICVIAFFNGVIQEAKKYGDWN